MAFHRPNTTQVPNPDPHPPKLNIPTYQEGPYVSIAPHEVAIADIQAYRIIHRIGSNFNKGPWYTSQAPSQYNDETCGVFGILSNKTASRRRRLFQAAGTKNIVAEWEPQFIKLFDLALQRIKADLQDGQYNFVKWWTFLASDVTGGLAFGEPFSNLKNGVISAMVQDIEAAMPIIGVRAELPWLKPVLNYTPTWCGNTWSARFDRFVGYGWDAVHATLDDEEEQAVPDNVIVSEAANVIVAGTNTAAMTLTYLTYAVLKNETVKKKLVAEVSKLLTDPRWNELENSPYLNNVIQEALKLHPGVPASLLRIVPTSGSQVDKHVIPAGTQICTRAWNFQCDPYVFEDPLRFNPDRWNNPTPAMKEHMMAFGAPARMCLGHNIARLEILHAVSKLFRECPQTALHPSTTEASMEMVDYFAIKPKAER
ncbi:cytochrome P450 [Karstenula rhodostoma CBS 690.94]|uniref:Cytochrome P450 n=1 Tax=Karstenula rhodostoma CBS 690.94 TaxID=1392251 RepID=A0A9P4UAS8_9PLEO|nr:cytochrome P450 [Karstenula rhodostoma CBS 690.94]